MTTKAYKEYVAAEKKKEQEALDQALKQAINASVGTTGNSLVDASISLISHNESGILEPQETSCQDSQAKRQLPLAHGSGMVRELTIF